MDKKAETIRWLQGFVDCFASMADEDEKITFTGIPTMRRHLSDALELIKGSEARLLALSELTPFPSGDVWLEWMGKCAVAQALAVENDGKNFSFFWHCWANGERGFAATGLTAEDYGVTWRCWSSPPSEERRKAVLWNVKPD